MAFALDVLFYSQVPNPDGIPADWPARVIETDDALPVTANATRMTRSQFDAYVAQRQAAYDAWKAGTYATTQEQRRLEDLRAQARDFLLNDPRPEMKALRAVVLVLVDELNAIRARVSNTATPAQPMPARTNAQALNAITNKLVAGSAD